MSIPSVRVEVAFASQPDDLTPAWTDVTAYTLLSQPINITHGRSDEFSQVQPSTLSLTLDNSDGRFTAGRAASPYYPNVKIGRPIRVFVGPTGGNLLQGDSSTFEGGTLGTWAATGSPLPTLTSSTVRAWQGTRSMLVTWPTGLVPQATLSVSGLAVGSGYVISMYVYVPTGSPDVTLQGGTNTLAANVTTSVKNAWTRIQTQFSVTGSVSAAEFNLLGGTTTAGTQVWVDAVQIERATTASTFTTSGPLPARFTGFVDEWPVEWAPGAFYAEAQVTATDRLKKLGQIAEFSNVMSEEILYDAPRFYYALGEETGSLAAGDTSRAGEASLAVTQIGSGGTLDFGSGTGPGKDGLSAPIFTPVNSTNGKYLAGVLNGDSGYGGVTLRASINTTSANTQTVVRYLDPYGGFVSLDTVAGKLVGSLYSPFAVFTSSVTSAASVNDGLTHSVGLTVDVPVGGGTITLTIYIDGVAAGTTSYVGQSIGRYSRVNIGGADGGRLFTGTISHVAAFYLALSASRILQQHQAGATGNAGESSDARLTRYARWAAIPATSFETGSSTSIAFIDTTGQAPLAAMQQVVDTEGGVLFVNGNGVLTFQGRAHRYNATTAATLAAGDYGQDLAFKANDLFLANTVTATRAGGITYTAVDATSVADYGTYKRQIDLSTTSDNEVVDAANWAAHLQSQPKPRIPAMSVDLLTAPTLQTSVAALEVGSMVSLTGLPSSAPATSTLVFIEGWTETVSASEWSIAFNASPGEQSAVFVLDDPTFGALDAYPLAY